MAISPDIDTISSPTRRSASTPRYALVDVVVKGHDVVATINDIGAPSGAPGECVVIESVTITESD